MQKVISTIRRKLVLSILLIALAALGVFVFAGCSEDYDILQDYPVGVTYDFQGGTADNKTSVLVHVKENSYIPAPTVSGKGVRIPSREGYTFAGFFLAETDENGEVVRDADGNISVTDTEWNFDVDTVLDKNITLCAKWAADCTVFVHYGVGYTLTSEIKIKRYADGSFEKLRASQLPKSTDEFTIISYKYKKDSYDENDEISANIPEHTLPDGFFGDDQTGEIWCESIAGAYRVIRTARDLVVAGVGEDINYYLLADLDMANATYNDEKASSKIPTVYNGKFIGNGHTVSNFTLNLTALDISCDSFGLFRTLGANAEISDVTFENVTLSYDLTQTSIPNYYLGTLAGQVSSGAVVKDVKITATETKTNTLEYLIRDGVSENAIVMSDDMFIGQKGSGVELKGNCSVSDIKLIASTTVDTVDADGERYTLYVKYTVIDDVITFEDGAIYDLAVDDSSVSILNLTMTEKNTYTFTRYNRKVYTVIFTVDNGEITAAISIK
ncbi:MAG: hypothetical protein K2O04_02205 [Clostridiales bacterium]|nr:hypothetical protein [Clostridiales bacterium]